MHVQVANFFINIYAGPPLPPRLRSRAISGTELMVEWEEPFTWPNHDILGYVITTQMLSGEMRVTNTSNTFFSFTEPSGIPDGCESITFTVQAFSDLGLSLGANLTTSRPKGKAKVQTQ